jgi:activator of 2-hydroxyglutaryl-CoA dehydratase
METRYMVGLDVGSTTVKAIVAESGSDNVVWQDYQRHETKQPEKVLEFLRRIEAETGVTSDNSRAFITGSGGGTLAELGGQDAKIIVFKDDPESGRKKKIPSMNDKCAGGTGAVIDKINAKLKIPVEALGLQGYDGIKLHKVAGKCGVFAETDINSLQKEGTPPDELMASLFEAIVLQNLSVLTRGHTLRPHVLLLGGPNTFIRGMREAWQVNIPRMWKDRKVEVPEGSTPQQLIKVPQNAQYFAALGAVEFGRTEDDEVGRYRGVAKLVHYIDFGRTEEKSATGCGGLAESEDDLEAFRAAYRRPKFIPAAFRSGSTVSGFVGVDGGSFWFPVSNRSVTDVRIFGATEMTIEYFDYTTNVSPRQ